MSDEKNLTDKQQAFVNEYLKCWNATEAAKKAGYSEKTAAVIGSENLRKPNIQEAIKARVAEMAMGADETLLSIGEIARGDISDFFSLAGKIPILDFKKAEEKGKLGLIKKLTMKDGQISFELYDKQSALNTLAKHHGLIDDKIKIDIDIHIVVEVVEALKVLGQDPATVFQEIINRAKSVKNASPN